MAKTPKRVIRKAHQIAKAIIRTHGGVSNPYAVGMYAAKRSYKKGR